MPSTKKPVSYIELRHAVHVRRNSTCPDIHVALEKIHYEDGTSEPNTRIIRDFKRPFWILPQQYRNYTQKREREPKSRLSIFQSTQSDLSFNIAKALGTPHLRGSIRDMANSPYVYGTDIKSTTYLRYQYRKKWPQVPTAYKYLAYDLETCVFDKDGSIIISSLATDDDQVLVLIRHDFLGDIQNPIERIYELQARIFKEYDYEKYMEGCKITYRIVPDEIEVIRETAKFMLEYHPEVVAAWNHDFDVPKLLARCKALGLSMVELFSDPSVPVQARRFEYKEGARNKLTSSGVFRPLAPSEQWHNIYATSGFMWLDAMCVYRRLRSQEGSLPSYSLEAISEKHVGIGKLHLAETEGMTSLERHQHMQSQRKLEYCIYGGLDPRLMILIERSVIDITMRLPTELAGSDVVDTASSSVRTGDMFFFHLFERGYILGSSGSEDQKWEREILPLSGWPLTLPNDLIASPGLRCFSDFPYYNSNIKTCCLTGDLVSAYPTLISVLNLSRETTRYEVVDIEDCNCSMDAWKMQNINLVNGSVNSLDYMHHLYGWPTLTEVDERLEGILSALSGG